MCIYELPTPLGQNFWVFASTKEKGSDSGYLFVTEEIASDNINIVIRRYSFIGLVRISSNLIGSLS